MNGRANTKITVRRGTETDPYGDEVDSADAGSLHLGDLPATLIEQNRQSKNPVDGEIRTIRSAVCRVTGGTDIRKGDRVVDQITGTVYLVESTRQPASPVGISDLTLQLSYTNE